MAQVGNKENCALSGEWGKHAHGGDRAFSKRATSKRRRRYGESFVGEQLLEDRVRRR